MKVSELIEELKKCNQDAQICTASELDVTLAYPISEVSDKHLNCENLVVLIRREF